MFMESQVWQKHNDYKKLIKHLDPPPPPGSENAWELHFCKWWGWNWVMKDEAKEEIMRRSMAPHPVENPKPEKKPVKNLCRCLRFKKNKNQEPLQDIYDTPSNSVIENPERKSSIKSNQDPESNVKYNRKRTDSVIQREIEEQVTKEVKSQLYAQNEDNSKEPSVENKKKKERRESSTTSSDECGCRPYKMNNNNNNKNGSSTESSVEYINIQCCPCKNRENAATQKGESQSIHPQPKITATQTDKVEKKRKRKRICVICCCNCRPNPPICCPHLKNQNEEKAEKTRIPNRDSESTPRPRSVERNVSDKHEEKYFTTYNAALEQPPLEKTPLKAPFHFSRKFEPLYVTGMPIDMMLYYNRLLSKLRTPSRYQSGIKAAKSDVWDQFSSFRADEFSSPVSGKTYNITPLKIDLNPEPEPSVLLEPLSVDEELRSLKKIEKDIEMDLKSRIMLDTVCDAILAENKDLDHSSSVFLNEFTYPSNATGENEQHKSEQKCTYSKLNQTSLDKIILDDKLNKVDERKINCETNTSRLNLDLYGRENVFLHNCPKVHIPQTSYRRVFRPPGFSLNYDPPRRYPRLNENNDPYKLPDYSFRSDPPLFTIQNQPVFARHKLQTAKRSASPATQVQDVKKVKVQERSTLNNTNVSDIFKKIDEIVLRSKMNNTEVQNVLNSIPKRTLQFYTSWEVSGSNQHLPVQVVKEKSVCTSREIGTTEEAKQKPKEKVLTQTKKRICARPSLIPKRVADFKVDKKM